MTMPTRVVRYLKKARVTPLDRCRTQPIGGHVDLVAYSDSDWVGDAA